jgi:hypothetical protein
MTDVSELHRTIKDLRASNKGLIKTDKHREKIWKERVSALQDIINKAKVDPNTDQSVERAVDNSYTGQIAQLKAQLSAMIEGLELQNDASNGTPEALKVTCQVVALAAKKYEPMKAQLSALDPYLIHNISCDPLCDCSCGLQGILCK